MRDDEAAQRKPRRAIDLAGRLALRPREAAEALGLSERTVEELLRRRVLPCVRVGKARLLPVRRLIRWLDEQADAEERVVDATVREALRAVGVPLDER